ncbi:MAG: FAD-binding protein [Eubacteriales bacterium]
MKNKEFLTIADTRLPVYSCGILVIGSGAAAYNAALTVHRLGDEAVLVTEGRFMGTSRNTGSDKQTYYKQSTAAYQSDSAAEMAKDAFSAGSMHGDLALVEAAGSLRAFFGLVALGVPFPHDTFGEYPGYRTDHDERGRATSCGPYTSKYMTEALEKECFAAKIPFFDGYRAVHVLTENAHARGVVCLAADEVTDDNPAGLAVFRAHAVLWATGGPSALYHCSVYPESQNCSLGAPLLAGASAVNLTESQYGIASVPFRWNLSGSFQQAIPRYVSVDANGQEREFLYDTFSPEDSLRAVFRKGYQWPFDPEKLTPGEGSSLVDIAVYHETMAGRRVYLDFRRNPAPLEGHALTREILGSEAYDYLASSHALCDTPLLRLRAINERAYGVCLDHGVDLANQMLEIHVAAQHMNGGLENTIWYENPALRDFYPIGECGGVFGVKRPGGSALNSTQVGSYRAAERACALTKGKTMDALLSDELTEQIVGCMVYSRMMTDGGEPKLDRPAILAERAQGAMRHDRYAAFLRSPSGIAALRDDTARDIGTFFEVHHAADHAALVELSINYDTLVTRYAVLSAILAYIEDGGSSRGSYLIEGRPEVDEIHRTKVLRTSLSRTGGTIRSVCTFEDVRPIPVTDNWFEEVYNHFGNLFDTEDGSSITDRQPNSF